MINLKTYVQDLKAYSERHNLSQLALAELLGVPRSTLSHWFLGDADPRFKTLLKIEQLFEEEQNNGKPYSIGT